jgi:hypothetical protein
MPEIAASPALHDNGSVRTKPRGHRHAAATEGADLHG